MIAKAYFLSHLTWSCRLFCSQTVVQTVPELETEAGGRRRDKRQPKFKMILVSTSGYQYSTPV